MLLSAKTGRVREATPLRRLSHKFEEMKNRVIIHRLQKIRFTYRNDPLENQVISEFRWVKIKRKSGSILLDNQQMVSDIKRPAAYLQAE